MKKKLTVFLALLIAVLAILPTGILPASAEETRTGRTFTAADLYRTTEKIEAWPHTWEAWIRVEKDAGSGRLGVIVGNYQSSGSPSANMEIRTNGNPSLWWSDSSGKQNRTITFTQVDVRTGEWIFLALTNTDNEVKCYVNGELKQTLSADIYPMDDANMKIACLGGDLRSGNAQYLKQTALQSAAIYREVRTAEQIAADMSAIPAQDPALLGAWDLSQEGLPRLSDLSGRNKNLTYTNTTDPSLNEPKTEPDTEPEEGLSFSAGLLYQTDTAIRTTPVTYEATVWFPGSFPVSQRGGVILGNYGGVTECFSFEIYSNGNPRLYLVDKSGKTYNSVFSNVNVYTGKWVHLAIVMDQAQGKLYCYVNGQLEQTISASSPTVLPTSRFGIGGDLRSGNLMAFGGKIRDIAMYSKVRTADQIRADAQNPGKEKDGLILSYDMSGKYGSAAPAKLTDGAGNGYDAAKIEREWWFSDKEPVKDYAYSFAVIGDTQNMNKSHPAGFVKIYDWILGNVQEKKIKYVLGLGDITNDDTDAEWTRAGQQFRRMDGIVPYSLVIGNHDSTAKFTATVNYPTYTDTIEGKFGTTLANTWRTLTVGKIRYLIFTLEYGANDAVLNWAGQVISEHPDCSVIITTHCYLFRDGTTLDAGDVVPPSKKGASYNNGDQMWDKLISKYENIVLVLSGHDPCDRVVLTQTKGEKGNTVSQILSDHQSVDSSGDGAGMITMLYFSEDGRTVQVECYSPIRNQYYLSDNQYTFTIDVVEIKEPASSESGSETEADPGETAGDVPSDTAYPGGDEPEETQQTGKGCGSAAGAAALAWTAALACGCVRRKKKKR